MAHPTTGEACQRIVEITGSSVYHALGLKDSLEDERKALAAAYHDRKQQPLRGGAPGTEMHGRDGTGSNSMSQRSLAEA